MPELVRAVTRFRALWSVLCQSNVSYGLSGTNIIFHRNRYDKDSQFPGKLGRQDDISVPAQNHFRGNW